jgi:hypothetical protein
VKELRDWKVDCGDICADPGIAWEILEFIEKHRVLSVAMTDGVIGCPHQEGVDYEGEWCPVCEFWHGRDRFTGHRSAARESVTSARARARVKSPNLVRPHYTWSSSWLLNEVRHESRAREPSPGSELVPWERVLSE